MHSDIAEEGRKRSKRCASTNDFHFYAALILDQYYNLLETALLAAWAAPALALVPGLDGSISIGDDLTSALKTGTIPSSRDAATATAPAAAAADTAGGGGAAAADAGLGAGTFFTLVASLDHRDGSQSQPWSTKGLHYASSCDFNALPGAITAMCLFTSLPARSLSLTKLQG